MTRKRIFRSAICRKGILCNTQETSTQITLSSLDMLILDIECCIRVLLLLQSEFTRRNRCQLQIFLIPIQVYPKFFLIRPIDECAEIEFSACQNAEKEHCETF